VYSNLEYLAVIWLLKKPYRFLSFRWSVWVHFSEMCFPPKGWQKYSPNYKNEQNVRILPIAQWFYPFPCENSMQKTYPMHLKTRPRPLLKAPGPEDTQKQTKCKRNFKLAPNKEKLGIYRPEAITNNDYLCSDIRSGQQGMWQLPWQACQHYQRCYGTGIGFEGVRRRVLPLGVGPGSLARTAAGSKAAEGSACNTCEKAGQHK